MPYTNPFGMVYDSGALPRGDGAGAGAGRLAGLPGAPRRGEGARQMPRHRRRQLRRHRDRRAAREGRNHGAARRAWSRWSIGTVSQGQGHETSFAQLITEWLGVPLDSVRLVTGDTDRVSVGGGAHSGRALRLASIVMLNASNEIIEKGCSIASHVLEATPADLEFADGRFASRAPTARSASSRSRAPRSSATTCPTNCAGRSRAESDETVELASFPYGCHVCEVEVDPETGVRRDRALQRGRRCRARGQPDDRARPGPWRHRAGRRPGDAASTASTTARPASCLSGSFMDYAMPRADSLPFFTAELSEVPTPDASARHPPGRRGRHHPGARRRHQRDRRCAGRIRRDPYRDAGDPGARLARHPQGRRLTATAAERASGRQP